MKTLAIFAGLSMALAVPVIAAEAVRFPPIQAEQYSAQQKQFADLMRQPPRNGNVVNAPFKVYFRSPEFGLHAIGMSDYLRWGTQFDQKQTEFIILLSARQSDSGYIWHAHYALAMKAGLDPAIPASIAAGKRPLGMSDDQNLLYDLITETYRDHVVSDATYDAAVKRFGEKGVTDAIGLAGYYGITAMALAVAKATYPAGKEPKLENIAQVFPAR
jgi:4-carboxymuconolactone decarboxylase